MAPQLWCILTISACQAQPEAASSHFTLANFDQKILTYEPAQRPAVTDKNYRRAVFYLSETRSATKNDPANLNAGDYWNITMAFLKLQEPQEHIALAFQKAITDDPEAICSYIAHLGKASLDEAIPELFLPFYGRCAERTTSREDFDLTEYLAGGNFDPQLINILYRIQKKDQRYRKGEQEMSRQGPLDRENQATIDSLYNIHGAYIGTSSVGPELEYVMWAVIQHSNRTMMERYLPVVAEAVRTGELSNNAPLKMLLDRIHWLKNGTQLFGSQVDVDLASDEEIRRIKEKYGLN
ncbi:hypothetical protein [Flavilitoribacter nigricans]|nr:hypothetical protein [Flavilitoribacter nigricans]